MLARKLNMALLPILRHPDPRLFRIASPVTVVDETIQKLVADMAETMYEASGIGLAATQVNVHNRVVVIDISGTKNQLLVLINPEITQREGCREGEEGCLSVPGIYEKVRRAEKVVINYLDLDGQTQNLAADGLLAACLQHETDHLNGRLFLNHLSPLKQNRIRTKLAKRARITA